MYGRAEGEGRGGGDGGSDRDRDRYWLEIRAAAQIGAVDSRQMEESDRREGGE